MRKRRKEELARNEEAPVNEEAPSNEEAGRIEEYPVAITARCLGDGER